MEQPLFLDTFTKKLCQETVEIIFKLFKVQVSAEELAGVFTSPPQEEWGHWALPCFFLSKALKKNPGEIATSLAKDCSQSSVFTKAHAEGSYVNLFFQPDFLNEYLLKPLLKGQLFDMKNRGKQKTSYLIEYSQPNTHKELHIGHLRNLCFGLALVTLLKKRGFLVKTCTFPGDSGTHVAKCLWYLKHHNKERVPAHRKGEWLGKVYTGAWRMFEEEQKNNKEITEQQITEILQQLYKKKGEFYLLWKKTRKWSHDLMKEIYQWAGVNFDKWYWESEVDKPSVAWIKELYRQKKLQLSEGAIGLDLGEKLGFCLLLKSDGNGLYATKDLYLIKKKFEDFKIFKNIYVVDQRQEKHFQQVLQVFSQIGFPDQAKKSQHLKYNFVELKSGPMSSRAGNIVPIMELIDTMQSYIKTNFLNKYKENKQWTEKKINHTAKIIAEGAIKYGMNEQDMNKKIVFDMEEWLKLDGRSGPYIQYAHARACTLLNKHKKVKNYDLQKIEQIEEWQLLIHLSWFSLIMEKSTRQMKPSSVCYYLFDLARKFSQFYQSCPIGSLTDEQKKNTRLALVKAVQLVLKEGLSYLAISAPEQM